MKIIAIANQKGGVGKTTTAINLCAALSERGLQVLLIDLDPQGNASTGLGIEPDKRIKTTYDILLSETPIPDAIRPTTVAGIDIVPSNTDLASADMELLSNGRRSFRLRNALRRADVDALDYDFVLIDCPPSLNLLTVNAMVAAHSVLVPLQSEFFALEGLSQLMLTVREVRQSANQKLRIEGVVLTMFDIRNRLSQQVEQDAREALGDLVFETRIPRNVRISEAPSYGTPVLSYDTHSRGAAAYRALASELLDRALTVAA
ncbi:MAG: AAA family ATPase [Paracoccaceae bacterium]|nr:AAA family ATPase [Paracoccaceae bacterium]